MGDLGEGGANSLKHLGTALWLTVIGVAAAAIFAGYAGGRSWQRAGAAAPALAMPEVVPQQMQRSLFGARGADTSFDPIEQRVEEVVVARPPGWAPSRAPALREPVMLAIVIRGIGADRTLDRRFAQLPYKLTFAVGVLDEPPATIPRDDPRALVVDVDPPAAASAIADALTRIRAGGILTAIAGRPTRAEPLVNRLNGAFAIDGMANGEPTVYAQARAHHLAAATRDVVIDARDEQPYIAYMIREAGRLARRTGVAIAVGHAYPETYEALRRTLPALAAEGIDVVPVGELAR